MRFLYEPLNPPFQIPDSWTWVRLDQVTSVVPTKNFQILQSEIREHGLYPVISQSHQRVEGYANDTKKLYRHTKPVLIFGDHTRCLKLIDFNFIVGADGVKMLYPHVISPRYLYHALRYFIINMPNRGYSRHFQFIKDLNIPIPPMTEQDRIVEKIDELERLIDILLKLFNK